MTTAADNLEFNLPNVRMRAMAWGPPNGRIALCMPGFPDSADSLDWSPRGADIGQGVADALAALPSQPHRKAAVAYYRNMFRFTRAPAAYAELHGYRFALPRRPMLLLHGDADGAMQIGYTETLHTSLPVGTRILKIRNAGHFVQVDQPEPVASAILDYLQRDACHYS